MKILIAADGSKFTLHAVNYLITHVEQFRDAELTLVTVHAPIPGRAASFLDRETVQDYYREECAKALKPAQRALTKAGMSYKDVYKIGEPGDEISTLATKGKFDMVIMGSHGHGLFGNLVLGSIATKVLAGCKVPVLVIR